jgi:hypothetical protein
MNEWENLMDVGKEWEFGDDSFPSGMVQLSNTIEIRYGKINLAEDKGQEIYNLDFSIYRKVLGIAITPIVFGSESY